MLAHTPPPFPSHDDDSAVVGQASLRDRSSVGSVTVGALPAGAVITVAEVRVNEGEPAYFLHQCIKGSKWSGSSDREVVQGLPRRLVDLIRCCSQLGRSECGRSRRSRAG